MTDQKLIEQIKSGSQSAFRHMVDKYQVLVFNTCIGFVGNRQSAEDLSQEVFIETYRSISKFRGEAKLSTWLYRISVNKSLNHIRDNKKHNIVKSIERFFYGEKEEKLEVEDYIYGTTDAPMEQQQHAKELHQAIESLPDNQQIAFTLHKFDDLSYLKIAEVMDVSISSVESLIHRAKKNLQKKLADYYRENF
ncbi:MAG: RNA polymerase sigma factor [Bacteroidetes bacterium]|nr:MAG: RNA polymerase sigma factor [Bacteroidota bacterium]